MNTVIDAIAASVTTDLATPNSWTVQKYDPIWRDPSDGTVLYIYGTRQFPGEFRTTETREDIYEVALQLVEAANVQPLERDETAEQTFAGKVSSLRDWADDHQSLSGIHRLEYIGVSYAADVRREFHVRYAEMIVHARKVAQYG